MKVKSNNKKPSANNGKQSLPGYPLYPDGDDIYYQSKNERDIDPEDISELKDFDKHNRSGTNNEKDFDDDVSGGDLDIPGSELDDEQENIGSEDEENNYYSLGGDGHNDLEEDRGE